MEIRISSKENRVYKDCVRLSRKKYRDREKRYLIEGENLVREALCSGVEIVSLLVREGSWQPDAFGREAMVTAPELFDRIAQTETSQGVLAIAAQKEWPLEEIAERCTGGKNIVVLDRLQDPGNIGTIIRTAEGAGYAAVVCLRGTADIYSPKVVRACAGSLYRMPVVYLEDVPSLRSWVDRLGYRITVTCMEDAVRYDEADLTREIALVIGNEGNGCSSEMIGAADLRVTIPMAGRLESLNASVAAGILMYETVRKQIR